MTTNFQMLYPDVDPTKSIPLHPGERFSIALAAAVLVYGGITQNLIVLAAGVIFILGTTIAQSMQTSRRIRHEARARFPQEDWAEDATARRLKLNLYLPLYWLVMGGLVLLAWWFSPDDMRSIIAAIVAVFVAVVIWFMPGVNPRWSNGGRRRLKKGA